MRVGSLFAGIGGFDLAARNVGWRTAWVSEIHPYACRLLKQHFPDAPNHGDITKIDFTKVEPVEVLCGGFPCQDISVANPNGQGLDGARSGLWSHYARAIGELRPQYVVVENVTALLTRGLERVLGDLATLGYDAEWGCIPACAVGAPHRRDRIWIVAHPSDAGAVGGLGEQTDVAGDGRPWGNRAPRSGANGGNQTVADPHGVGVRRSGHPPVVGATGEAGEEVRHQRIRVDLAASSETRSRLSRWWLVEPPVGRVADGIPHRVDRLHGLGNAIVPQIAELLFRAIQDSEKD